MVRDPVLFDSGKYANVFEDLDGAFNVSNARMDAKDVYFGNSRSGGRIVFCKTVADVEEARVDTVLLKIPRRIIRLLEQEYNTGEFGFWIALFPLKYAVVRLHFSFSHPLMRDRLFVPSSVFSPKGVPFGERDDICNDEDPRWSTQFRVTLHAINVSASSLPRDTTMSLEDHQIAHPTTYKSGLVRCALPDKLEGGRPIFQLRSSVSCSSLWLALSSRFLGVLSAESSLACGNLRAALRTVHTLSSSSSSDSSLLARCAAVLAAAGCHSEANALFERAAQRNALCTTVFALLARAGCERSSSSSSSSSATERRAHRAWRRVAQLDPYDAEALAALAVTRGDKEETQEETDALLRRALILQPDNEQAAIRMESINEEGVVDLDRADRIKKAQRKERKEAGKHIENYIRWLDNERKTLFPGQ